MANLSIYTDQFKRPDSTNISTSAPMGGAYTEVTGDTQIVSGALKNIGLNSHVVTVDAPVMNTADYYVQAIVYTNPSNASGIGLIIRYVDASNYYYARINTFGNTLKIIKRIAGSETELGNYNGGYTGGNSYTLKFSGTGTTLKAYVNGTERISVTDSDLTSAGKPGLWSDYGNSTWNNFVISGDMTKTAIPAISSDYSQPDLPTTNSGWKFNSIDEQVVTKSDAWNQDATKRNLEFDQLTAITGITHVAIAVPYENLTKYTSYVAGARAKGLKVFHRSHWNSWEGDNSIPVGLSRQDYLEDTYRFIVANPTLFAEGDLFGMCVEPNNANDNGNYTFRTPENAGGNFTISKFNEFCKDQVKYANAAFAAIGLERKIYTFPISPSVSLLNLGGQSWTATSGNNDGLGNSDFITYFGGYCSIDHYEADAIRTASEYDTAYNNDLDKWALGFPGCKLFIGEFGYHTTTSVADGEQLGVFDKCLTSIRSKNFIVGFNAWVHMASTTASLWLDSSGTVVAGGRRAVEALRLAFSAGNAANGKRIRA